MLNTVKLFSKLSFVFLLTALTSAGGFSRSSKDFSIEDIRNALKPASASADIPYGQSSYYSQSSYYAEGSYGCGSGGGCCGCGCGCGCC